MGWLRRFFYSDDPIVKVAAGLPEAEAVMLRDILEEQEIAAFTKNMNFLTVIYEAGALGNGYDLFVKQSDFERAREILKATLEPEKLVGEDSEDEGL